MKIKVSDLTNEQLNEWVARAQPDLVTISTKNQILLEIKIETVSGDYRDYKEYSPTSNPAQWAELMQVFKVDVLHNSNNTQAWACVNADGKPIEGPIDCFAGIDEDGIAICRAVISSVYGEYVEIEE